PLRPRCWGGLATYPAQCWGGIPLAFSPPSAISTSPRPGPGRWSLPFSFWCWSSVPGASWASRRRSVTNVGLLWVAATRHAAASRPRSGHWCAAALSLGGSRLQSATAERRHRCGGVRHPGTRAQHCRGVRRLARSGVRRVLCHWGLYHWHLDLATARPRTQLLVGDDVEYPRRGAVWHHPGGTDAACTRRLPGDHYARLWGDCTDCLPEPVAYRYPAWQLDPGGKF